MEDIELVIKIPEKLYTEYLAVQLGRGNGKTFVHTLLKVIKEGIVLPKGHGRLIDADMALAEINELKESPWYNEDVDGSYAVRKDAVGMVEDLCVKEAPTVIEANNIESEV